MLKHTGVAKEVTAQDKTMLGLTRTHIHTERGEALESKAYQGHTKKGRSTYLAKWTTESARHVTNGQGTVEVLPGATTLQTQRDARGENLHLLT